MKIAIIEMGNFGYAFLKHFDILCEELNHVLEWNGQIFKFINTPGHTPGSICILFRDAIFSGDTILNSLKTITKLPRGSKKDLKISINKIKRVTQKTQIVYPSHGDPFPFNEFNFKTIIGE